MSTWRSNRAELIVLDPQSERLLRRVVKQAGRLIRGRSEPLLTLCGQLLYMDPLSSTIDRRIGHS